MFVHPVENCWNGDMPENMVADLGRILVREKQRIVCSELKLVV
jgi:hypothetical protein